MPETDAVRRSSLRRDKLLSKMGTTSCANIVQIINYRFSLFSSDLHLCDAASKLVSLREDLESLKSEADLKLRPSAKRGEKVGLSIVKSTRAMSHFFALPSCPTQPFDKTNPYHLRRAFGDLDPAKLVRCYKRPLRHVRFEDEIEHPLKTNDDGVWFVKTAEVPPKILIRRVLLLFIVVKCGR